MSIKLAVIFPGQGSQSVGMLSALAKEHRQVLEIFSQASEILGYDLWHTIQHGDAGELNKTHITQPAILTSSVAIWNLWQQRTQVQPLMMAGHSLGEYSALVCAGVMSLDNAIRLVELRGRLMQEAVAEDSGAMYAIIGLEDQQVANICQQVANELQQVVCPVNFNSIGQVVIAGHKEAVKIAAEQCKAAGAKRTLPLPVSVPSHCELMKPAAEKLSIELDKIEFFSPHIPVINNVDVTIESSIERIKNSLVRQLYNPVRWTEIIKYIENQGITHIYEIGPGKVLTGLTKRIAANIMVTAINDPESLSRVLE